MKLHVDVVATLLRRRTPPAASAQFDREYGAADRSPVDTVVLVVRDVDGIASTTGMQHHHARRRLRRRHHSGNDFKTQ
uniref:Uncharacterized protein n=1 Tax=Oryza barthii TaxID=65489 RepID=A0A0D3HF17_9ORYZ